MYTPIKYCTGVEEKSDGTLVYRSKRIISLIRKKNKVYEVDSATYTNLKRFVVIEIIALIVFLVWHKVMFYPLEIKMYFIILFGGLFLGEIIWYLMDNYVKKRALRVYEEL